VVDVRIEEHPILKVERKRPFEFAFSGEKLRAYEGETIAAALFANGIRIFGNHQRDGSPQGIFCANGQCAQCLVIADGKPLKACMTAVRPGMQVEPVCGLPELPKVDSVPPMREIEEVEVQVLIIGGGPAGLSAAIELGRRGIKTLIVEDKSALGGKLVLQTHRFFGSSDAVYAGTRGIDIAAKLEEKVRAFPSVEAWLNSSALAVFSDHKVGILRNGKDYVLVEPEVLLVSTGARERSLVFRGNTLPGVYGAGAFQTLVNRDLVKAAERLFIVGGGNVGLIAGYHAIQAGIQVAGLAEALPECGGYKIHRDKLARLGVPIYTSHTVISANGKDQVESVTIAQVDEKFNPISGTEKSFACDTLLVAVGLDPVDEFYRKALEFGITALAAGDAKEVAEASAAIISGEIAGLKVASALGLEEAEAPNGLERMAEVLASKPGLCLPKGTPHREEGVFPVIHCRQEIPCNPCASACPRGLIHIDPEDIRKVPEFVEGDKSCIGCERCVVVCPGLAIALVDYRKDSEWPTVTLPYELSRESLNVGEIVTAVDEEGNPLGEVEVTEVKAIPKNDRTLLIELKSPRVFAEEIAGLRVQAPEVSAPLPEATLRLADDEIACRCERVTVGEIRKLIREGCRDMNEIKAATRAGMGPCGGKVCGPLIKRLFLEEGISLESVTDYVRRPLFLEVPLSAFAGASDEE